jgi:hypothetical protein
MDRYKLIILLFLFIASPVHAGMMMMTGDGTSAACADASCTGFMFCQNFEGTGYDNSETWTEAGTVDEDSTSPALRGKQSCSLADSSSIRHDTGGTYTELYSFARYQFADATPSISTTIYKQTDGAADFGYVLIQLNTGKLICYHGTASNIASSGLSDATTYYIWFHFKAETSSGAGDGIMTATVSTTRNPADATAALGCSVQNGNDADANIDTVWFMNSVAGGAGVSVDQILVKTTSIGTVCE